MYISRLVRLAALVCVGCMTPAVAFAQVPTADDFLPVVQGGPSDVKQPQQVAVKGKVVSAATAQDAVNAAVGENVKGLKNGGTPEVGAKMVTYPSGLGFVATGLATYRTVENPTLTRIAKRKAYVIAFTKAKKNLAEILGGLDNQGKETVREALVNINLPKEEMTNLSTESQESLKQAVDMMLRGFVIYEVKDDTRQNTVFVSIVTTPKTRGQLARPAPNVVESESLRRGLNQVIAEVRSGLVPPVGGRIIMMRSTGETAFVGFGSAVVRTSANQAVQAKLNLDAQKIAGMRSKDALCGLIIGDKASWEGSVVESLKDQVQEFESAKGDDPLANESPTAVKKLAEARQTLVSRLESNDLYQSTRRGILPPGVNSKTWFDEDHAWAYGMSVYAPSLSSAAARSATEMHESQILQPNGGNKAAGQQSGGFTDDKDIKVQRPGKVVKPGPSGKIDPE
ncbi:MAG: hypothetical protein ACLQNE_22615 [Thermoguttaceae bacterium]